MTIPDRLKQRYRELVAMASERVPGWTPPPLPPDEAGPNAFVCTNHLIVERLTGRPALRIRESKTPLVIPERQARRG